MITILFLFLCFEASSCNHIVDEKHITFEDDLKMERQINLINKLPVKSIQTKFGYIVDCVDINKQLAFDHPLLKNHKLQRKPNFHQTITKARANSSIAKPIMIGLEKGSCPVGTVPIRRATKKDLIHAKSSFNTHINSIENPGVYVAEATLQNYTLYNGFRGVSGIASLYNPHVDKNQSSAGHLWVQNDPTNLKDKIIVGWNVSPQLYGDDGTHIYTLWTSDNFQKTGCYNIVCPGFVQVNPEIYIGVRVDRTSVYGGDMIELPISITKDTTTGNWWLRIMNKNVGYFPEILFPNFSLGGQVGWGGQTTNLMGGPTPPMGSGYFPDDNFLHASYFRQVAIHDSQGQEQGPEKVLVDVFTDDSNCFGIKYYDDLGVEFGNSLQYGGPGGECSD